MPARLNVDLSTYFFPPITPRPPTHPQSNTRHACNPTLHEPCSWSSHCHGDGPWSDIGDDQWQDLITEGTALNNRLIEMMDDISQYLQWLKDEGVEVLFRPWHEMNQGW